MNNGKVIELKIKQLQMEEQKQRKVSNVLNSRLQTNPILEKMFRCNDYIGTMKFQLNDLFR